MTLWLLKTSRICLELKENHLSREDEATPGCWCLPNAQKTSSRCEWWADRQRWHISTFNASFLSKQAVNNRWLCFNAFLSYLVVCSPAPISKQGEANLSATARRRNMWPVNERQEPWNRTRLLCRWHLIKPLYGVIITSSAGITCGQRRSPASSHSK